MSERSEKVLASIWAEVLARNAITPSENFFDIGGDSLKAMEVISRVGEVFKVELPFISFFEDPTIKHMAGTIDELSAGCSHTQIIRAETRKEFPLSFSQQAFWLLEQQNPGSGIYNSQYVFRVRGRIDRTVLERSLDELRRRHEILRVRLVLGPEGPVQIADASEGLTLSVSDVSSIDSATREREAISSVRETIRKPFDLAAGPLLRAHLVVVSEIECILCLVLHHTISDGFSGGILLEELGAIYQAFATGLANPLPDPDLHFTDYAAWERSSIVSSRFDVDKEYWRGILEGAPCALDLPADSLPESPDGHKGHLRSVRLSPDLSASLSRLAQESGTTLFTVLSAAFRVLLYQWTAQSDFVIGTVASNRSRAGTERMIGCFVNPLPLRNTVSERQTLSDVLKNETTAVMGAFAHQDCPFARIVEAVNPHRTAAGNPLFNVALLLQNFPVLALAGASFQAESISVDTEVALLDLRFIISEIETGLHVACEYKAGLFTESTIDALLEAYAAVLSALSSSPDASVRSLLLSDSLSCQADEARNRHRKPAIVITASFTALPIEEPLKFLLNEIGMEYRIAFAPYQQVFQQLLDPASVLRSSDGFGVVLLRVEDWLRQDNKRESTGAGDLAQLASELVEAVRAGAGGPSPLIVSFCPPSQAAVTAFGATALLEFEAAVASALAATPRVQTVRSCELLDLYPVSDIEDEYSRHLGNIPYTTDFFSALASMLVRRIWGATENRYEVIALDATSIVSDELGRALVGFRDEGMLLCLCSTNKVAGTSAALQLDNSLLTYDDFVASAFACHSYVDGLRSLASELALELDSFIFLHEDPAVCADVESRCPEVLTLLVPSESNEMSRWLKQVWAFDRFQVHNLETGTKTRGHALTA